MIEKHKEDEVLKKFVSLITIVAMLIALLPTFVICNANVALAASDAMTSIESELSAYKIGDTVTVANDGYIGIPVEATTFYDTSHGKVIDKFDGTMIFIYVVNTCIERIGTDSDVSIIKSMLDRGYVVTVVDYLNNPKAVSPDLDWSAIEIRTKLSKGTLFSDKTVFPSDNYQEIYTVPAGYNVDMRNVFWEFDKHGADGSYERVVEVWNNDFRGCKRDSELLMKWTRPDGSRKETQNGFDGSEPQWYDADGTLNNESGEYIHIQHTKAVDITDPVRLDGTPLDYNLYASIIYPTNPEKEVAVMTFATSSATISEGFAVRPHFNGFLFNGYVGVTYDYGFVPMEKERNDIYNFAGSYTGGVTGDNITYSLQFFNDKYINTAAMRYIRYVAKTDERFGKWNADTGLGVYGISKSGWINFLGTSHPETLPQYSQFVGHHGETRYDNGLTTAIEKDGYTIDAGEPQPWQSVNGERIASNVNFIHLSVGACEQYVTEDFCPAYNTICMNDVTGAQYHYGPAGANVLRIYDIPSVNLELPIGHTLAQGKDLHYGADGYKTLYDMTDYYLRGGAVNVVYISPISGADDIEADERIKVQFTGPVLESEIAKVTVKDSTGKVLNGTWEPSHGKCLWEYNSEALEGCETYTVTVPSTLKGENGVAVAEGKSVSFSTAGEKQFESLSFAGNQKTYKTPEGTYVYFTMPDKDSISEFYTDSYNLRFRVSNDAANAVELYSVKTFSKSSPASSVPGELLDTVYLRSDGYYEADISSYLADTEPGSEIAFFLKRAKTPGEFLVKSPDFSVNKGGAAVAAHITNEYTEIPGENKSGMALYVGPKTYLTDTSSGYTNTYYKKDLSVTMTLAQWTSEVPESWFGRRFRINMKMYDTGERQVCAYLTKRHDPPAGFIDYDWGMYNVLTKENTWSELDFEYQVYEADIGKGSKGLVIDINANGYPEKPLYITDYTATEIITDVVIDEASIVLKDAEIVLETEYGTIPETYKSVEKYPFVLFKDSDKSFVKAFGEETKSSSSPSLWYDILHNMRYYYKTGYTLLMRRNYEHTGAQYPNLAYGPASLTIDLGGYTLSSASSTMLTSTSASMQYDTTPETTAIKFKNGKIKVGASPFITFNMYNNGDGKGYDFDFENIEFGYIPGATTSNPLMSFANCASSVDSSQRSKSFVDFTDCIFKFTDNAPSGTITLFSLGSSDDTVSVDITVNGGKIKSDNDILLSGENNGQSTLVFGRNAGGEYLRAEIKTGKAITSETITTADGTLMFQKDKIEGIYDNYILEVPLMETVGLIKTGTDKNIRIYDGTLCVFSSPLSSAGAAYKVDSSELVSSLSSTNGYTLSYVDKNKNTASQTSVSDGYIKAEKAGSSTLYIPINKSYPLATLTGIGNFVKNSWEYNRTNVTFAENHAGFGGKSQSDVSAGFTSTGATSEEALIRTNQLFATADDITSYTVEFNVYADGDAVAAINLQYSGDDVAYRMFKWDAATGKYYLTINNVSTEMGTLTPGRWHRVVMNYNYNGMRLYFYVDGEYKGNSTPISQSQQTRHKYMAIMPAGSGAGKALFDDVVAYTGFYYPENDVVSDVATSSLSVSSGNEKLVFDRRTFGDLSSLASNVSFGAGANSVNFFKDGAFSQNANTPSDAKLAVLTSPSGNGYWYYDVTGYVADDVKFTLADGKLTATSSLILASDNMRIFLVSYSNTGTMVDVAMSDKVITAGNEASATLDYNAKYTYKAFIWGEGVSPLNFAAPYEP